MPKEGLKTDRDKETPQIKDLLTDSNALDNLYFKDDDRFKRQRSKTKKTMTLQVAKANQRQLKKQRSKNNKRTLQKARKSLIVFFVKRLCCKGKESSSVTISSVK